MFVASAGLSCKFRREIISSLPNKTENKSLPNKGFIKERTDCSSKQGKVDNLSVYRLSRYSVLHYIFIREPSLRIQTDLHVRYVTTGKSFYRINYSYLQALLDPKFLIRYFEKTPFVYLLNGLTPQNQK